MALSQTGDVYTWGMNYLGQLGLLDTVQRPAPVKVRKSQPGQLFIAFIAAGAFKFKPLYFDISAHPRHLYPQYFRLVLIYFVCRGLSHAHDRRFWCYIFIWQ